MTPLDPTSVVIIQRRNMSSPIKFVQKNDGGWDVCMDGVILESRPPVDGDPRTQIKDQKHYKVGDLMKKDWKRKFYIAQILDTCK